MWIVYDTQLSSILTFPSAQASTSDGTPVSDVASPRKGVAKDKSIQRLKNKISTRVREESISPTNEEVLSDPDDARKKVKSRTKAAAGGSRSTAKKTKTKKLTKNATFSDEKLIHIEKDKDTSAVTFGGTPNSGTAGVSILEFLTPQASQVSSQVSDRSKSGSKINPSMASHSVDPPSPRKEASFAANEFVSSLVYTNPFSMTSEAPVLRFAGEEVDPNDVSAGDLIGCGVHGEVYFAEWKTRKGILGFYSVFHSFHVFCSKSSQWKKLI